LTTVNTLPTGLKLDVVFVIADGPSMAGWQSVLASQLPELISATPCPHRGAPPSLHVGVISPDLGLGVAAGAIAGCSPTGDGAMFRYQPEGMCTDSTLDPSATFIFSTSGQQNFSAPDDAAESGVTKVFDCIAQLGDGGCAFGQPLAALDRALGADGASPPAANQGFLRPDAYLAIVIISNQDDCSAAPGSTVFSTDTSTFGPLVPYRCNHTGHRCLDPSGNRVAPPIVPPDTVTDVDGVPTLQLTQCQPDDLDGSLTPVSKIVADIKSLKPDPDHQILAMGIIGPPTPYAVQWVMDSSGGGTLVPRVAPSCGTEAIDGSGTFAEPSVRLTQFINAFPNSTTTSICDSDFKAALLSLCAGSEVAPRPLCIPASAQMFTDEQGRSYPDCAFSEHLVTAGWAQDFPLPSCAVAATGAECWSTEPDAGLPCLGDGQPVTLVNQPTGSDPADFSVTVTTSCQVSASVNGEACSP
jgi:hypothetical protein